MMNGKMVGNENNEPTKTLLSFMIKSPCSRFQDMVAMIPVVKNTAELMHTYYLQVLEAITEIGL